MLIEAFYGDFMIIRIFIVLSNLILRQLLKNTHYKKNDKDNRIF